ncbi:small ubiquitin-related modifier 3-like isoform X1 [Chaetodon auriga]|uniref:small ubiquitin-related modifier 3-like isoform X1 n=1 Tax=Chaetodon auriga TaxID=39042 RepID=UPI004032F774
MSEEKPKEGVKTENDHINLKVAGQDGSVVQFKIKRHTPLSKLMKAYCERQVSSTPSSFSLPVSCTLCFGFSVPKGLAIRQIRFRFDGQPINETDTPAQLEMEDEDTIDVFQQQTGGVEKAKVAGHLFKNLTAALLTVVMSVSNLPFLRRMHAVCCISGGQGG